jgi:arginyl-tRNA synthetase
MGMDISITSGKFLDINQALHMVDSDYDSFDKLQDQESEEYYEALNKRLRSAKQSCIDLCNFRNSRLRDLIEESSDESFGKWTLDETKAALVKLNREFDESQNSGEWASPGMVGQILSLQEAIFYLTLAVMQESGISWQ